jgi:hypothetical protein
MFSAMDLDNLKPDLPSGYQCGVERIRANNLWITFCSKISSMNSTLNSKNVEKVTFS